MTKDHIDEEYLFEDTKYLSSEVQSKLHEGYKLYPLRSNDYYRGYLDVLSVLTEVGKHTINTWNQQFGYMKKHNDTYYTITITDERNDRIAATGTILVEHKFVHTNGLVGHIEDIAVDASHQGKKLGIRIIEALKHIAEQTGCYKDCSAKNIPFYEKCGFTLKENQMAWYISNKPHL
ncbi:Putative Glucosamine-phosphate N-acetyltransferase [Rhizopus microsporus]|nr:Putative Glucosamine-phosphate N-acetyltransferase [Rhizopus microsporus]